MNVTPFLITIFAACIPSGIFFFTTKLQIIKALEISQAVTNTKITNLTEEVRKHNNFAQQIPEIKAEIKYIKERYN